MLFWSKSDKSFGQQPWLVAISKRCKKGKSTCRSKGKQRNFTRSMSMGKVFDLPACKYSVSFPIFKLQPFHHDKKATVSSYRWNSMLAYRKSDNTSDLSGQSKQSRNLKIFTDYFIHLFQHLTLLWISWIPPHPFAK